MTEPYVDPPNMPAEERMSAAEFKVVREGLGLSDHWIATHLSRPVNPRTVRNWEQGRSLIPDDARLDIEDWEVITGEFVTNLIDQIMDIPDPVIITYAHDKNLHIAHPEIQFPAAWHRRVVWRIAQEVPGLAITYADSKNSISPELNEQASQ